MDNSILTSIKKKLGITEEYEQFDQEIIMDINTVFSILSQLGVGPEDGFEIENKDTTWSDYINDNKLLNDVRTYMYLKVRLMFDPPMSSIVLDSFKTMISELEFRINITAETTVEDDYDLIIQGSNDSLILSIDDKTSDIVSISAVLYRNGASLKQWTYDDITLGNNEFILPLSEEDTLSFPVGIVKLETKWKMSDGNINVGNDVLYRVVKHNDNTRFN